MAKVKNVTKDVLSLFSAGAPPCEPGDTIAVSDAKFVGRAWPKSTWDLVEPPKGDYMNASLEDAWLYIEPEPELPPEPAEETEQEPTPKRGKSS